MKKISIFFLLILSLFSIFSYLFVDPNLFYLKKFYTGFAFKNREIVTTLYVSFLIFFYLFYVRLLFFLKKEQLHLKDYKFLIGGACVILFLSYPAMVSFDIFNYLASAKTLFFYHENPYIVMPVAFTSDPLLLFMHAANKIALYGPFWILATAAPYFAGLGNFLLTLFSFKLFILLFYVAILGVIWKISRNLFSVTFFALNPLVIIETLVSSHNDIVMMFFAVSSFYLLKKRRLFFAGLFLVFSILIKYSTIVLLPIFLYAFFKAVRREKVNWDKIYLVSAFSLFGIFITSILREELYPWYVIWFLTFAALVEHNRFIVQSSIIFSFVLLFHYVPFMLFGKYIPWTSIATLSTSAFLVVLIELTYRLKKHGI